jgi:hypothetical protein
MKKKNALINALESHNVATGNGALSHSTTGTSVLDFFGKGGALRSQSEQDVINVFSKAYGEDKTLALKALFYLSDVRGGQGERRLFRVAYNWLAKNDAKVAKKLLKYIPEYTRFDNILETLENTSLEKDALSFFAKQLKEDATAETPSLAAKWAPSEQASSQVTRRLAAKLRTQMKLSPKNYRKLLSSLRQKIGVVERLMCSGDWNKIEFSHVPSNAAKIYKKAFNAHVPDLYSKFLTKVEKGETKINASVLYPYDIVREAMNSRGNDLRTIDAQWKALPDFLKENPHNGLVVADVSGSMDSSGYYGGSTTNVRPIDVSVSLAIYFAERNVGAFKGHFMIFGGESRFMTLNGGTIQDKVSAVLGNRPCPNTNLKAVFDTILKKGLNYKVPQKEMPSVVYIVSDMQFDVACGRNDKTNLEVIREKYKAAGYKMPTIVFWNVNSYSDTPVKFDDKGVCLVSGCSPSILKTAIGGKVVTPYQLMLDVLNGERYKPISA